jgi:hypothetical protein
MIWNSEWWKRNNVQAVGRVPATVKKSVFLWQVSKAKYAASTQPPERYFLTATCFSRISGARNFAVSSPIT